MGISVVPKLGFRTKNARHVLLALVTLVFFVLIVLIPWSDCYHQLGTSDWKEVETTIDVSEIREYESCHDEGGCSTSKYPYIRYSYSVDGVSYSDDDIVLFPLDRGDYGFSTSLIDEYPYGSQTTAYYNPEDPNQAVLMKGFSGVLPVINMLMGIVIFSFAVIVIFLIVWKVLFHIQPRKNKEKAEKQYVDDIDDEREEREQRLKLRTARKVESFQGQSKVLSFQIDGEKGDIEVRNVVDIFDSPFITRLLETLDKGILFLEDTHDMGRNLEFRYTIVKGNLVLDIGEFVGEELIREQSISMDYHPSDARDFVTKALKLATPETDEWWK